MSSVSRKNVLKKFCSIKYQVISPKKNTFSVLLLLLCYYPMSVASFSAFESLSSQKEFGKRLGNSLFHTSLLIQPK